MQEHAYDSAGSGEDIQSPRMVSFDTSTAGSEAHRGQDAEGDHSVGSGGEEMGAGSAAKRKRRNDPAVIEAQVTLSMYMGIFPRKTSAGGRGSLRAITHAPNASIAPTGAARLAAPELAHELEAEAEAQAEAGPGEQ